MSFFTFLFGKPFKIKDDKFGEMIYVNGVNTYFESKGVFKATGEEIDFYVYGPKTGPTSKHKEFLDAIEDTYQRLTVKIKSFLEEKFRLLKLDFKIQDFKTEFMITSISFLKMEGYPFSWEMSFGSVSDLSHVYTITFVNFDPKEIRIEG